MPDTENQTEIQLFLKTRVIRGVITNDIQNLLNKLTGIAKFNFILLNFFILSRKISRNVISEEKLEFHRKKLELENEIRKKKILK